MKKQILFFLSITICFSGNLFAQVKIGDNPTTIGSSSLVEMESTNKGLVIPRMTTAQLLAIASPVQGMVVYNTDSNCIVQRTSIAWQYLCQTGGPGTPTPIDWHLTGNAGTVDGTNFLGTTDNIPLSFRVNNQQAGRIDHLQLNEYYGYQSGNSNTTDSMNAFFGHQAGTNTTTGQKNTAFGYQALIANTQGVQNNATGYRTLYSNTIGTGNNAVGWAALYNNISGDNNNSIGGYAGSGITTGSANSLLGYFTMAGNGDNNSLVGYQVMKNSTSGSKNTGIGAYSLWHNNADNIVAVGYNAGQANTTGVGNQFIGYEAGYSNTTGYSNLFSGFHAGYFNVTGFQNTFVGDSSGFSNTGNWNTGLGFGTLFNSTGGSNTAIGRTALYSNTTGSNNISIGFSSSNTNITGSNNTLIGTSSDVAVDGLNNATALGYSAVATASNTIVLGNNSITALKCNVQTITALSDARFKTDIRKDVPGLDFILKLTPVTYHLNVHKLNAYTRDAGNSLSTLRVSYNPSEEAAIKNKESIQYSGFIAQDVEKAAEEVGYDFSGVYKPQNSKDTWGLGYSEFVVPLVKSVQELSEVNKNLNNKVNQQQAQIDELIKRLEKLESKN
jgi:hypothetical protein